MNRIRRCMAAERGAAMAEYATITMAAVAFGGMLGSVTLPATGCALAGGQ